MSDEGLDPRRGRSHAVLGTAGHVDHGKTSLLAALTGVPGDRLPEEQRRGITIDLGFSAWELPGLSVSVVDVPGHERFVQTMVAGAAGFDLVLLVVAADDGVMPQTREHLAICTELGVRAGLVAITKRDLVDDEMLALVIEDVRDATEGTFLEGATMLPCSVRDGRGLEAVRAAIIDALGPLHAASAKGPPWLSVDRAFTKQGFGTVVTGTLVRGAIATEDTLEVLGPAGVEEVVVRGLAVHGRAVARASATTRLAVNLRGATRGALPRGVVLTGRGAQRPTRRLDVELRTFADAPRLGPRTELVLHVGTAHATVRARALLEPGVEPGTTVIARLTSESDVAVHAGQRFVLRRPELALHRTIAGGTVLDPHPPPTRVRRELAALWALGAADLEARVPLMVAAESGGTTPEELRQRLPPGTSVDSLVARLVARGALHSVAEEGRTRLFASAHVARAKASLLASLATFHLEHPALSGATSAELRGRLPPKLRALTPLVARALAKEGAIVPGERLALPAHDARRLMDELAAIYRRAGLTAGAEEQARAESGLADRTFADIVSELVRAGRVVRLASGLHVDRAALDELTQRVRAFLDANETLSPGDFKVLSGLTRKTAIATLEWLDREGVTRRRGELRVRADREERR